MAQFRQGDVLLIECPEIPKSARPHPGTVVAHGEATGHSHRFSVAADVTLYDNPESGDLYAEIKSDVALVHEEHAEIRLTPGIYRIRRQREYTPGAIRSVID